MYSAWNSHKITREQIIQKCVFIEISLFVHPIEYEQFGF